MTDDRAAETDVERIGRIDRELADLRTTLAARMATMPTGDIEPTLRATAKAGTLLLNGATLNRTDYPALWQWAQDQSLVIAGLFGAGNGSTTFTLPDLRGRVVVGAGTLGADTYALGLLSGASSRVIATNQMPSHDHNVSAVGVGNHGHNFGTSGVGDHGGHHDADAPGYGGDNGTGARWPTTANYNHGGHSHSGGVDQSGSHNHTINETAVGGTTPFDVRQPSIALNWLIWT